MPKGKPQILTENLSFQVSKALNQKVREGAWSEKKGLGEFLRELVSDGLKQRDAAQLHQMQRAVNQ